MCCEITVLLGMIGKSDEGESRGDSVEHEGGV